MNFLYMLGISNTSNTSDFYSKKVEGITMSHQQVVKLYIHRLNNIWKCVCFFDNFRDYAREVNFKSRLIYSPVFCKHLRYNLNFINVNKVLKQNFSTNVDKLDPNWVTGFVDAEGCFSISVDIPNCLIWKVKASFEINLHEKDKDILYKIKSFFGVGVVYHRRDRKKYVYTVTNLNNIKDVIIPHFTSFPLISIKRVDFLLWLKALNFTLNNEDDPFFKMRVSHIISYYAYVNSGILPKYLKHNPFNIVPVNIPVIKSLDNLQSQWVSGFVAGDGGFSIYVRPTKDYALLEKVYCRFHIAQHIKDQELLKLFIKFFGCGIVAVRSNVSIPRCDYIVEDTSSILDKVLPHFDRYPLLNLKQEDFICFKECLTILKSKEPLTQEGLKRIKELNLEMNSNRFK